MGGKQSHIYDQRDRGFVTLSVDAAGDVVFDLEYRGDNDAWDGIDLDPAHLVQALEFIGVLPQKRPAGAASDTPSDRIRESWRRAAAEDPTTRLQVDRAVQARRIARERAERAEREREEYQKRLTEAQAHRANVDRLRAARERAMERYESRTRYYRDCDGAIWRTADGGMLTLYRHDDGVEAEDPQPVPRGKVASAWGPLTEIADPLRMADAVARLRDNTRRAMHNYTVWGNFQ